LGKLASGQGVKKCKERVVEVEKTLGRWGREIMGGYTGSSKKGKGVRLV
jgi:hypothetical protein